MRPQRGVLVVGAFALIVAIVILVHGINSGHAQTKTQSSTTATTTSNTTSSSSTQPKETTTTQTKSSTTTTKTKTNTNTNTQTTTSSTSITAQLPHYATKLGLLVSEANAFLTDYFHANQKGDASTHRAYMEREMKSGAFNASLSFIDSLQFVVDQKPYTTLRKTDRLFFRGKPTVVKSGVSILNGQGPVLAVQASVLIQAFRPNGLLDSAYLKQVQTTSSWMYKDGHWSVQAIKITIAGNE